MRPASCPSREDWLRFFDGVLSDGGLSLEEKEALIEHPAGCPECRIKFEALTAVEREVRGKVEDIAALWEGAGAQARGRTHAGAVGRRALRKALRRAAGDRRREAGRDGRQPRLAAVWASLSRPARAAAAAAGAVILLSAAAALIFQPFKQGETSRFRGEPETVEIVFPKGEIAAPPDKLVWKPSPGADSYTVHLADEDLKSIPLPEETVVTTLFLGKSFERRFVPGKTYVWKVIAHNDIGENIASGSAFFIIKK